MRKNYQMKGIFCLEGLWDNDLRKPSTVRPILELLRVNCELDYIYRDCATKEELEYYLKKWTQMKYKAYPILYLASHGEEFVVCVGQSTCDLDYIAGILKGKCRNRIAIFASCSTLNTDERNLKRFLQQTDALAIFGYKNDVAWLKSTAFELLMLSEMQDNEFSGRGITAIKDKLRDVAKLFKGIEFRSVINKD